MNKEFLKMQKMAGLITESQYQEKVNEDLSVKIEKSNPDVELYKVTNFPKGGLENEEVKNVLNKITQSAYNDSLDSISLPEEVEGYLNRLSSRNIVYVHPDGEGRLTIVDSLKHFSEGYRTEEEWGVKSWENI